MLLMSCSGAPIGSDDSVQNVVSTSSSQSATTQPDTIAAKCDRIGSRVIREFVASFNDGVTDLDPYFASGENFQWFSGDQRVSLGRPSALYDPEDRSTLIAYLNEVRRTQGPITIRSLKFTGLRQSDMSTGFAMELEWDGHRRLGKVSVDCGLGQIEVWSLGDPILDS